MLGKAAGISSSRPFRGKLDVGWRLLVIGPHKSERLDPFHSDNAPFHATASSLPRLSIISTPCSLDERPALVSELNR